MKEEYNETGRERLRKWQSKQVELAREAGEDFFLNFPDLWYEPYPVWGCENGHLSRMYLKSEERGVVCLSCHCGLFLIPKIEESELEKIVKGI